MIRISIVTDFPMHCPAEEEREEIANELRGWLGETELVYAGFNLLEACNKMPDLLLLDYGGAYTTGTSDTIGYNLRYARQWAEDHPGKLLVLWTRFTGDAYKVEAEEELGPLDNVCYPSSPVFRAEMLGKIKGWFVFSDLDKPLLKAKPYYEVQ